MKLTQIESIIQDAFSNQQIDQLGRDTGQSKRLRIVTPYRLFLAIVTALASGKVEAIADLLREFNYQNETAVAYKAFYNRLDRPTFPEFMRQSLCRLLGALALQTLRPEAGSPLSQFKDIVIQDGSSFAIKDGLRLAFPGRFTTREPAAIEVHATWSGFEDNVLSVALAPDKEAERPFLPTPQELVRKLLLADRGYPSVLYFQQLSDAGASFIIRLTRSYDPWVLVVYDNKGKPHSLRSPRRLSGFLSQHQNRLLDMDVAFMRGQQVFPFRLVAFPGNDKHMTRLCTNLDRALFPADLVGRLYRFRWQVELLFKEWKSYANLHRFNTENEHIVQGLIWGSLCAATVKRFLAHATQLWSHGVPISTRRVAMCARHVLDDIVAALLDAPSLLRSVLRDGLLFLLANARRAHPKRDRLSGRLQAGLAVAGGP